MRHVRAVTRAVALAAHTTFLFLIWIAGDIATSSSADRQRAWRRRIVRPWARGVGKLFGMRLHVCGTPPAPPVLLVSNHLSYMDIIALSSVIDGVYVARGDVENWPVVGRLCRAADIIFIDRSRRTDVVPTGHRIANALEAGDNVILFPEGTSTRGADVGPFKSSLLEPAAAHRLPVRTATMGYRATDVQASMKVCWWGDMELPNHIYELLGLRGFDADVRFGSEPITDGDRKQLAERLREAVIANFVPVK